MERPEVCCDDCAAGAKAGSDWEETRPQTERLMNDQFFHQFTMAFYGNFGIWALLSNHKNPIAIVCNRPNFCRR